MSNGSMKVSSRLTLGFGAVVALLVVIAAVGVWRLAEVNTAMDVALNDRVPKVDKMEEVSFMSMDNARIVRNIVLIADEKGKASNKVLYDKNNAAAEEILETLQKSVHNPTAIELIADTRAKRAAYSDYSKEVIQLGLAGKTDEATTVLYGDGYKTQAAFFAALRKLVDHEKQLVRESTEASHASYLSARAVIIGLGVLACALAAVIAFTITRSLTRELGGEPSTAASLATAVAQGDLRARIATRDGDNASLMAQLKAMQESLVRVVSTVRQGADGVATASAQIAQGNSDLSGRTEQQASALQETAASMEQLSSTVRQNADNARQANQLAMSASTVAVQGGEVVSRVVDTMKGINDSSKKIADIISVIDGIAFQTNILALNAAVEAARAGEQGRGFAVVASEVRSLAGRSAEAAKEIKKLIIDSVERVEQGTALVDQAGITMTEVVGSIRRVTDIVGEISAASHEQASGVAQIGDAVTQMDQATQQNAALVEEMAASAASLESQARELVQAVAVFNLSQEGGAVAAPPRAVAPTPRAAPVRQIAPARATADKPAKSVKVAAPARPRGAVVALVPAAAAAGGGDWESF